MRVSVMTLGIGPHLLAFFIPRRSSRLIPRPNVLLLGITHVSGGEGREGVDSNCSDFLRFLRRPGEPLCVGAIFDLDPLRSLDLNRCRRIDDPSLWKFAPSEFAHNRVRVVFVRDREFARNNYSFVYQ